MPWTAVCLNVLWKAPKAKKTRVKKHSWHPNDPLPSHQDDCGCQAADDDADGDDDDDEVGGDWECEELYCDLDPADVGTDSDAEGGVVVVRWEDEDDDVGDDDDDDDDDDGGGDESPPERPCPVELWVL